jgi:hypothetical protein
MHITGAVDQSFWVCRILCSYKMFMYTIQDICVHVTEHLLIAIGCTQLCICIYMSTWGRGKPNQNVAYCSECLIYELRNYIYNYTYRLFPIRK